jgi:hypothetical protein
VDAKGRGRIPVLVYLDVLLVALASFDQDTKVGAGQGVVLIFQVFVWPPSDLEKVSVVGRCYLCPAIKAIGAPLFDRGSRISAYRTTHQNP